MKTSNLFGLMASIFLLLAAGQASAVMMTDRIDHTDAQADTYFWNQVPDNLDDDPYYRNGNQSWDWEHNAFAVNAGDIVSATLSIRAWDVDPAFAPFSAEVDEIWADNNGTLELIGVLDEADEDFSTTVFNLDSKWFDDIVDGLMLSIMIDQNIQAVWEVTLDYSELTIDVNQAGVVPVPAAVWLFGTALLGFLGYGRGKSKVA